MVFFDDITVYGINWDDHFSYLATILGTLMKNQLLVNQSKCLIGQLEVQNLGHIISATGVSVDPKKIYSMATWPVPSNTTALLGFLGLTGYYQKFIQGYGAIAVEAEKAFHNLKQAMKQAPILILPDFSKLFAIEADASGIGLGAILM